MYAYMTDLREHGDAPSSGLSFIEAVHFSAAMLGIDDRAFVSQRVQGIAAKMAVNAAPLKQAFCRACKASGKGCRNCPRTSAGWLSVPLYALPFGEDSAQPLCLWICHLQADVTRSVVSLHCESETTKLQHPCSESEGCCQLSPPSFRFLATFGIPLVWIQDKL